MECEGVSVGIGIAEKPAQEASIEYSLVNSEELT